MTRTPEKAVDIQKLGAEVVSYVNEHSIQSFDTRKIQAEFPMHLMCIEDFVKAWVAEWKDQLAGL